MTGKGKVPAPTFVFSILAVSPGILSARTNLASASDFINTSTVAGCVIGQSLASRPNDDLQRSSASGVSEGVVGQHHISQGENVSRVASARVFRPEPSSKDGVVTVSTRPVVSVMLCDQSLSKFSCTGLPWTPTFAIWPPAATILWQVSKLSGRPTASIATSHPSVLGEPHDCFRRAAPSVLLMTRLAPHFIASSKRFLSLSIAMILAGE